MRKEGSARLVSLYLPLWPTERLRRKLGPVAPAPDAPLALARRDGNRRVVTAADLAARKAGLKPGTPVAKARALFPDLTIMEADPDSDRSGLENLALWFQQRIAPIVAVDSSSSSGQPDGIVLETTGADHLHGGEPQMLDAIIRRLAEAGLTAKAAIAGTWSAAHALARYGRAQKIIVPQGRIAEALTDLPIEALRLPASLAEELRTLGVSRIGKLETMPRGPLTLRFGSDLERRLDQAYGRIAEPIHAVRPVNPVSAARNFADPIAAAETIARYIGKLVPVLCEGLDARGDGVRQLDLLLHRVDNMVQAIRVTTARPVREPKHLTRLLCEKIETIEPGFGIERMELVANLAEPIEARQHVSSLIAEEEVDISGLIDTLANRVGSEALYRFTAVESDIPERSVCRVPALAPDDGTTWPVQWPRPTRLLARPEPVQAMAELPDQPPLFFIWRGIRHRVKCADGPERVFGEWWKNDTELTIARDYFRVEDTAGERFWLFRAGDGEHGETGSQVWFLHGLFA